MSVMVSVIVPAYNAQDTISETIEAVLAQSFEGEMELIVVDDGSRDQTREVVQRYPQVRYLFQQNAGPACARNAGARVAAGEFLLFTDSDCQPEPGWINKMVSGFSSHDIGAVAGSYAMANPESSLSRVIHGEILFRHSRLMSDFPKAFGSYNVAIRKSVFDRVGGFEEAYRNASGEDNDLSYKVLSSGYRIRFVREARVAHYHQSDLAKYLKEQFRHGFWRVKMYLDHPKMSGGDGYTFWKDIVEVPLVLLHVFLLVFPGFWFVILGGFFAFEVVWGLVMLRTFKDGCLAACVMWFRSFARTAGFCVGGGYFLKYHLIGPKKT